MPVAGTEVLHFAFQLAYFSFFAPEWLPLQKANVMLQMCTNPGNVCT